MSALERLDKGGLVVRSNRQTWNHDGPLAVVHAYDIYHHRETRFPVRLGEHPEETFSDGFAINAHVTSCGINARIEFHYADEQLRVLIPHTSIGEQQPWQWLLYGIEILPEFDAQPKGAPGYLVWPNYSGAQCLFNKDCAVEFRDIIYSDNGRWENFTSMPIFGLVAGERAYLAIVSAGQYDCELIHRLGAGPRRNHSTTALFRFREHPRQEIDAVDREILFTFFEGAEAQYVAMAKRYRRFLIERRGRRPLRERRCESPALDSAMRSQWLKIFCAEKVHQRDGEGAFRLYTTFEEARKILEKLMARGIDKITCMLVGWNPEGHDGRYPDRLPPEERLGGAEKLRELIAWGRAHGLNILFHDNYVDGFARAKSFCDEDAARDQYGFRQVVGIWAGGESYRLRPTSALRSARRDLLLMKREFGLEGCYYIDAVSLGLEPDFTAKGILGRRHFAEGQLAIVNEVKRLFGACQTENSMDYVFDAGDACASVMVDSYRLQSLVTPIKDNLDALIPFFQIAWHGLVLYHHFDLFAASQALGGAWRAALRELSLGALGRSELTWRPHPEFAHAGNERYLADLARQYRLLSQETNALQERFIEDYRETAPGVTETVYDDGTVVHVDLAAETYRIVKQ